MPFELLVAVRFLREGRIQTVLLVSGVAVGVAVMVFLSALITGLQQDLIRKTLGTQAHVVLRPLEDAARPVAEPDGSTVFSTVERSAQRRRSIANWPAVLDAVRRGDAITAAAATLSGSAFAVRGSVANSVELIGIEPASYDRVIPVSERMTSGDFALGGQDAVIGVDLAEELGLRAGDRMRLAVGGERDAVVSIRGLFDLKNKAVNARWVFVPLRTSQSLLDLAGGATAIELTIDDIFAANDVADELASRTGLRADSWMRTNEQLLIALRSQGSSSGMIQFFVVLAVALGIASVLVVSVVQKGKEIGILKAMGTVTSRVNRVFLLQGAIVGLGGSAIGCALGAGLTVMFATLVRNADGTGLFPLVLDAALFFRAAGIATVTGILAAVFPARRAARLDPAVVIRNG